MIGQLKKHLAENRYRIAFTGILLLSLGLRLVMFMGPMEYDEIWTGFHYVHKSVWAILTDLATPNNHPLNSLFVKLWTGCFDLPQLIRLHSLVFGMLSVVLTGMLARGLFHSRAAALFSMLFIALDAAAVCYSDLARGYSAQLCFLLCFSCGIAWSGRLRRCLPWKEYLPEAMIVLGALGAVLAVPSAPIFLAAVVIAARCYRRKTPEASVMIALGISGALVAAYLGMNQTGLREAQKNFGVRFTELGQWFGFVLMLLQDFCPLATAPFLLVLAATDRKRGLLLLLCAAVVLVSPAFTSAGPSRVYLPLTVLVALGCGRGAHVLLTVALCRDNLKLARLLVVAAVFLGGFGYYQLYDTWHITDYWSYFKAGKAMPPEYLVVYPASTGNPMLFNNYPMLIEDQTARLEFDAGGRRMLCFGVEPGTINGGDPAQGSWPQTARKIPAKGTSLVLGGFPAVEYALVPAETPRPGEGFVVVLPPARAANSAALRTRLVDAECGVLVLNQFFGVGLVCSGIAPSSPELWATVRKLGARVYTFVPDATAAQPATP